MAHQVICLYCKKKFDADIEPFVKPNSTRYAHLDCHEQAMAAKSQEDKDKEALETYIKQLFNIEVLDVKIRRQIKQYITEYNYSYSGILATLKYAFEVKHNSIEKAPNDRRFFQFIGKGALIGQGRYALINSLTAWKISNCPL